MWLQRGRKPHLGSLLGFCHSTSAVECRIGTTQSRGCVTFVHSSLTDEDFYITPTERHNIVHIPKITLPRSTKLKIRVHTPSPQPPAPLQLSSTNTASNVVRKVSPLGRFNLQLSSAWLKKDIDAMISLYREMRDCGIKPNLTTVHHILRAYDFAGMVESAFSTVLSLDSLNIKPTTYTFNIVLSCLSHHTVAMSDLGRVFTIVGLLEEHGLEPDILTMDAVITACSRAGNFSKAWEQLVKMQERGLQLDVRVSQTMLSCCVTHQRPVEAVELLQQMDKAGVPLRTRATEAVMRLCLAAEDLRGMEEVLIIMKNKEITPSTELILGLIGCASKRGHWRLGEVASALVVGEEAQHEAGKHLLAAYAMARSYRQTILQAQNLASMGLELNPTLLQSVTDAWCLTQEILDDAFAMVSELAMTINASEEEEGEGEGQGNGGDLARQVLLAIANAILKGYSQRGDIERAYELFGSLDALKLRPNRYTFHHMIEACREGRKVESATRLFERLYGEAPSMVDDTTYELLMSSLICANRLANAFTLLEFMRSTAVRVPSHNTYALLIRKLHRLNDQRAVRGLIAEMTEAGQPPDAQLLRYIQKPRITPYMGKAMVPQRKSRAK